MTGPIEVAKQILAEKKPLFGICLGHQVIAISQGISTYKMRNGHRGINHPILNLETKKGEITSQNHGFAIDRDATEINDNVNYYLELGDDFINLNQIINSKLELNFEGYQCLNCSSDIQIYRQGHCKKCFFELPSTAEWVMKPELSKAHLNIEDRDLEFEKDVQLKPHILYLAYSSNVKAVSYTHLTLPTILLV